MILGDRFTAREALGRGIEMAHANGGRALLAIGLPTVLGLSSDHRLGHYDLLVGLVATLVQF